MFLFVVILLVLAAAAGVLGAVLKVTLVIVLSLILTIVVLAWLAVWYAKRRMRQLQRDVGLRMDRARRRDDAHDVGPTDRGLRDGS